MAYSSPNAPEVVDVLGTWLLSILQNLVAIAIVLAISWRHDSRDLFLEKAAAGAAIHLATLAFGMVLWRGEARQWPFYRLKQWLVVMGFVIAVATSPLLLIIAQAHDGTAGWASALTLFGAMWATMAMLYPVRGAMIGYSFGFAFLAPIAALAGSTAKAGSSITGMSTGSTLGSAALPSRAKVRTRHCWMR